MNLDRRASILGLAAVAIVALLAWWALRSHETSIAPRQTVSAAGPETQAAPRRVEDVPNDEPSPDPSIRFATFRGRVIDAATREPVREFELTFLGMAQTKVGYEAPGSRKFSTKDGRFEWQYLPPGSWNVTADATGYQHFVLDGVRLVKGEPTAEIVLPLLRGNAVRGRIYDEATHIGIAAARISFREAATGRYEGDWRSRSSTTSAKDGSFLLNGVPAGRMTLEVSANGYAGREVDVVVGDDTKSVEVGLSTGAMISGRLTAADGATPVAGWAGLTDVEDRSGGIGRTGPAGEFEFPNLAPGTYRVIGRGPRGSGSATREFVITGNERIEGIVLALRPGRTIRGTVTGLSPADLKRVRIRTERNDNLTAPEDAAVNERGEYEVSGVEPGRVDVVADANVASRRQVSRTVEVPATSDITVDLEFPRGMRLSGRVTQQGKPLAGVSLAPRSRVENDNFFPYGATTSANGDYVIEGLPPGEYWIRIDGYRTRSFKLASDTVFDIDIPKAQLAGRVLEEDGNIPLVGAAIDVWPADPDVEWIRLFDRADHLGRFAVAGLEPGAFTFTIYKPGYELYREQIRYSSPLRDMTIRLRRDSGVALQARDAATGKPLQQLYVYEMVGERNGGISLHVDLDEQGLGAIPTGLAGATVSFASAGYVSQTVTSWDGDRLDLKFVRGADALQR
jgi:hypothetical protein